MAASVYVLSRRLTRHHHLLSLSRPAYRPGEAHGLAARNHLLDSQFDLLGERLCKLLADGHEVCSQGGLGAEWVEDPGSVYSGGDGDSG